MAAEFATTIPGILRKYFSRQQSLQLMLKCSEIVTHSEAIVEQKLNYLIQRASHKPEVLVKSKTLSYPYRHIVMRHEILIRAGLFRTVGYNKMHKQTFATNRKIVRDKYFTPADIVCSGDKVFLWKCTNNSLSLNELAAFEDVFAANYEKWGLGEYEMQQLATGTFVRNPEHADEDAENDDEDSEDELEILGFQQSNAASKVFSEKDMGEFYY